MIKEAKAQNPHSPLGPAELCLLTLGQVSHLNSRLQLWAFALDYDSLERVSDIGTIMQWEEMEINQQHFVKINCFAAL